MGLGVSHSQTGCSKQSTGSYPSPSIQSFTNAFHLPQSQLIRQPGSIIFYNTELNRVKIGNRSEGNRSQHKRPTHWRAALCRTCLSPNSYVEVLIPNISCDCIWRWGLKETVKLKYAFQGIWTQISTERRPYEDAGKRWPRREVAEVVPLIPWSWTSASRIMRKYVSVVGSPSLWYFVLAALAF